MMKRFLGFSLLGSTLSLAALGCVDGDAAVGDVALDQRSALASSEQHPPQGPAAYTIERIGSPAWEPVDFHQVSADLASHAPTYFRGLLETILPAPNHVWNDALGIAPGAAHPPPYDDEIGDHLADLGLTSRSTFSVEESNWPNMILGMFMVVPSDGAPTGSSPDFESGPIIPHTICPIHVDLALYFKGMGHAAYSHSFDVVPLDTIDPPLDVDGHSHFPIFIGGIYDEPGEHVWSVTLTDLEGNGWKVEQTVVLQQRGAP